MSAQQKSSIDDEVRFDNVGKHLPKREPNGKDVNTAVKKKMKNEPTLPVKCVKFICVSTVLLNITLNKIKFDKVNFC